MSTALVTGPEAALLSVARCAVGLAPPEEEARLLSAPVTPPGGLGPTCRRLLQETLSTGVVLALAREGGWYQGPQGRLWERGPLPPLELGPAVVELLLWVLRTPLARVAQGEAAPLRTSRPFTPAEGVVATVLLARLQDTGWEGALAEQAPLRSEPLVVLAHVAELAKAEALEEVPRFDLGAIGFAVEGLRALLARAWVRAEHLKAALTEPAALRRVGEAQGRVLEAFLDAADAAGRRDLATFLIDAGVALRDGRQGPPEAGRALSGAAPMRERSEARRAAPALARALGRLEAWDQEHRTRRFFDDGYQEGQALARDWQRLGPGGFEQFRAAAAAVEALA